MRLSQNGVNFIKAHEALRLKAYQDSKGVWTIGWGHTKNVHPGDVITREQAEQFIRDDFAWVERTLNADLVTGRDIDRFMCLDCLAAFFHTTPDDLQAKIDAFRDDGCPLFE